MLEAVCTFFEDGFQTLVHGPQGEGMSAHDCDGDALDKPLFPGMKEEFRTQYYPLTRLSYLGETGFSQEE